MCLFYRMYFDIYHLIIATLAALAAFMIANAAGFRQKEKYMISIMVFVLLYVSFHQASKKTGGDKEGLTRLLPGAYPESETVLPVQDQFPAKKPVEFSNLTYSTMWKDYPTFPADSMETNLIKYWGSPDNGTCSHPEQCNALYEKVTPQQIEHPTPPQWGSGVRVNFYDTCLFGQ